MIAAAAAGKTDLEILGRTVCATHRTVMAALRAVMPLRALRPMAAT